MGVRWLSIDLAMAALPHRKPGTLGGAAADDHPYTRSSGDRSGAIPDYRLWRRQPHCLE
jgi:hypothetical protein